MDKNSNYLSLKEYSLSIGVELFGVAPCAPLKDKIVLSQKLLTKLDYAICLGVGLSPAVLHDLVTEPNMLYSHHYKTANTFLDDCAFRVARFLARKNFLGLAIPASQIIDWEKQTSHLSHKQAGVLAGLGWIGRNNLLVNRAFGAQLRLVTILTDMPLATDEPPKDGCGSCAQCVTLCPAGAIKNDPAEFDHKQCAGKLKEFSNKRMVNQYICGVCVNACKGKDTQLRKNNAGA
jgi:epoxyqueuosine reductase